MRRHYMAPRLAEEQGREALSIGLDLQETAVKVAREHAKIAEDQARHRRVIRLSIVVFVLEFFAGASVAAERFNWWPT